jgi:hypothetical protein
LKNKAKNLIDISIKRELLDISMEDI